MSRPRCPIATRRLSPSPQVSGIVLLAVGVWGRVSLAVYFSLLDEKATNVPFVLVGAGVVVVLLGTFGCFATCRGSTWMLKLVGAPPGGRGAAVPVGVPDPSHPSLLPAVRHAAVPHLPHRAGGCRRRVCFQARGECAPHWRAAVGAGLGPVAVGRIPVGWSCPLGGLEVLLRQREGGWRGPEEQPGVGKDP